MPLSPCILLFLDLSMASSSPCISQWLFPYCISLFSLRALHCSHRRVNSPIQAWNTLLQTQTRILQASAILIMHSGSSYLIGNWFPPGRQRFVNQILIRSSIQESGSQALQRDLRLNFIFLYFNPVAIDVLHRLMKISASKMIIGIGEKKWNVRGLKISVHCEQITQLKWNIYRYSVTLSLL